MSMIQFLFNHFMQMIPIVSLGILGAAVILERWLALYVDYPIRNTKEFFNTIRTLVMHDKLGEAASICDHYSRKPIASVVRQGLLRAHQPQEVIEDGLNVAAGEAVVSIKARTSYLSMIANVSTLLGLIGTIMGLIKSFEAVGGAHAQEKSALLAQGISMSMNHTLWGLCVAVPCMVAYTFLMARTNKMKAEVERSAVRTMDILKQRHLSSVVGKSGDRSLSNEHRRAL